MSTVPSSPESQPRSAADAGPDDPRQESIGQLLSDLSTDVSTLVRQEISLAQAELTDKAKAAGVGAGMLAGAAVLGLAVLGSFTTFLIVLLDLWMWLWLAALIVTVLLAVVVAALALAGRSRLRAATPPKPEEAVESVKEDVQWAKTQLRSEKR